MKTVKELTKAQTFAAPVAAKTTIINMGYSPVQVSGEKEPELEGELKPGYLERVERALHTLQPGQVRSLVAGTYVLEAMGMCSVALIIERKDAPASE